MHHQRSSATASPPPPSVVFSDHSLRTAQFLPLDDKLAVAAQLYRLGVNVCEAGFPAGSDDQYMAVHQIAKAVGRTSQGGRPPMQICAVTKPNSRDIERSLSALREASNPRVHLVFGELSQPVPSLRYHLMSRSRVERLHGGSLSHVVEHVGKMVALAASAGAHVEVTPPEPGPGGRARWLEEHFVAEVMAAAIEFGASTVTVPDGTICQSWLGGEYGDLIAFFRSRLRLEQHPNVVLGTHCNHDKLNSIANSLAGVANGAGQVSLGVTSAAGSCGSGGLDWPLPVSSSFSSAVNEESAIIGGGCLAVAAEVRAQQPWGRYGGISVDHISIDSITDAKAANGDRLPSVLITAKEMFEQQRVMSGGARLMVDTVELDMKPINPVVHAEHWAAKVGEGATWLSREIEAAASPPRIRTTIVRNAKGVLEWLAGPSASNLHR